MSDNTSKNIETLRLDEITCDPSLQMREALDDEAIEDYSEAMKAGKTFPPVVVLKDAKGKLRLADGFHRYKAALVAGLETIEAEVCPGEYRDALLHAAGANADNSVRRTQADKRKAVRAVLHDRVLSAGKSNRQIAEMCNLSEFLVRTVLKEERAINRTQPAQGSTSGEAPSAGPPVPQVTSPPPARTGEKPPPDAGDAWEKPAPGSEQAQADKAAAKAADVPRDQLGHELPRHLRDTFADPIYHEEGDHLLWLARRIVAHPDVYVRFHCNPDKQPMTQKLGAFAKEFAAFLEYHRFHSICPDCKGEEHKGCTTCYSTGWLSKGQYEERMAYQQPQPTA